MATLYQHASAVSPFVIKLGQMEGTSAQFVNSKDSLLCKDNLDNFAQLCTVCKQSSAMHSSDDSKLMQTPETAKHNFCS